MVRPAPVTRMTYAEYVAAEAGTQVRHEFLAGEVWAMAGGMPEHGLTTYPDVSVVCGNLETAPEDPDAITNPVLLVEVLSDSAYDRGAKAAHYRRIPSLREYMLVAPIERRIEVQRRIADRWELVESGETIELVSVGVRLDVRAIFANPLESSTRQDQ